jgi:hypothetical protein
LQHKCSFHSTAGFSFPSPLPVSRHSFVSQEPSFPALEEQIIIRKYTCFVKVLSFSAPPAPIRCLDPCNVLLPAKAVLARSLDRKLAALAFVCQHLPRFAPSQGTRLHFSHTKSRSHGSDVSIMNKLANMRHWSERMGPGFGMSRPNMNMTAMTPQQKTTHGSSPILSPTAADTPIHYSFNVPFASDLAGPNVEDILYATSGAVERWTHPADAPDDVPIYELPVHAQNVTNLRKLCKDLTSGPLPIEAHVKSSEPKRVKGQVTNVCLSGSPELVHKSRETILNDTPLALVRQRFLIVSALMY